MAAERGPIQKYLAEDHARLEELLARSVSSGGAIERGPFDAFRAGLLRHIAIEEKILFREARAARGGEPLELFRRLRIEHGALASLLVPTPTAVLVTEIRSILGPHNEVEEGAGGLYERCDALLAAGAARLLDLMRAYPPVKVAPYNDGPRVLRTAEAALRISAKQFEGR
jgi:hemerythrin HHE cation binding domain-containing protein